MTFLPEATGLAPSGFGPGLQNGQKMRHGQEILSQVTPCEAPARPNNAISAANSSVSHANGG
ncbi:MAG: hypothetical protein IOC55_13105 [Methylobacterium sp.]|nr:hypothetical protein [Methylobacterium sp.]